MKLLGCTRYLDDQEINLLHEYSMRILTEIGIVTENKRFREDCRRVGFMVDEDSMRVRFPREMLDGLIERTRRGRLAQQNDEIRVRAGGYPVRYLDPQSEEVVPSTTKTIIDALRVTDTLEAVDSTAIMGFPVDVPADMQPLYIKYLGWKYYKRHHHMAEVNTAKMIPFYKEMCRLYAGGDEAVFKQECIATVYMDNPFRITDKVAEQFYILRENEIQTNLGAGFTVMGLNTPATLTGAIACTTAMSFLPVLLRMPFMEEPEEAVLELVYNLSGVMDMRTALVVKSRPEILLSALAACDLARFYNVRPVITAPMQPQGKVVDSFQVGFEKGIHSMLLLAGAESWGSIGQISQPEAIFSPVQMLLDTECISVFRHMLKGFEINEQRLGLEAIRECLHVGIFLNHEHTVKYLREEIWEPEFSIPGISFDTWKTQGARTSYDLARDKVLAILESHNPDYLEPDLDKQLREVLARAEKTLA